MFARSSRYAQVPEAVYVDAAGREIPYKLLRILPPRPEDVAGHLVVAGDRLDLLAHRYLGDSELFWYYELEEISEHDREARRQNGATATPLTQDPSPAQ